MGWPQLLAQIQRTGGFLSINHPVRPSGEACMGCGFTPAGDFDYHLAQGVEVVNGLDADTPFSGVPFWEHLLDQGYRLTAIGGSDSHDALKPAVTAAQVPRGPDSRAYLEQLQAMSGGIGVPTTVVHAAGLSEEAILAGLESGRVFIDVAGSPTSLLDLDASAAGDSAHMGGMLIARRGATVHFQAHVSGVADGSVQLIIDGHPVPWPDQLGGNGGTWSQEHILRADGRAHWARLTVRDSEGRTLLIGNPIYLKPRTGG
jgi:hypothetical protein